MRVRRLLDKAKLLFVFIVVLSLLIAASDETENGKVYKKGYFNPRVDEWYVVEQWELELCQKMGAIDNADSTSDTAATRGKVKYKGDNESAYTELAMTTVTLQARKLDYNVDGEDETLYEVSWYLEPKSSAKYKVELVGDDKEKIKSGTASAGNPAVGYHVDYYDEDFSHVKITYGGDYSLKVPIKKIKK